MKTVIVTGAAGGLGRAACELFRTRGYNVVGGDLAATFDGADVYVPTDVGDAASVRALVQAADDAFGSVDALFATAANTSVINTQDQVFTSLDEDVFDDIWRVCARGMFLSAKYAALSMMRSGGGSIVLTGTVDAQLGCPGLDAYTAAKGAVQAMTRSMAAGVAQHRIRVNAIAPSFIQAGETSDPLLRDLHMIDLPRYGDVANLAVFLCSSEARALTGSIYQVDAGYAAFKCGHVRIMPIR